MSQAKNTRSKRKLLPNEISVSLKTPKSRQLLFSNGSRSNLEDDTANTPLKRTKRKKLRKTQNFVTVDDEGNQESSSSVSSVPKTRKKLSSKSSENSEIDGNISSEVFLESEQKPKSKKSRKKRIKLPVVNLDDFGSLDNTVQYSEGNISSEKKNASIDSVSSSASIVNNEHRSKKKSKKKNSSKKQKKQEDNLTSKTRSSKKTPKDKYLKDNSEIDDENKENSVNENYASHKESIASKKRSRAFKPEFIDETDQAKEKVEMLSNEHFRTSKKRRIHSCEITNEEFETNEDPTGSKNRSNSKKKRRIKSEIMGETDEIQVNFETAGPEHSQTYRRSKRTTTRQIPDDTKKPNENLKTIVENTPNRRSRQMFHSESVDKTGELAENIEKLGKEVLHTNRRSVKILNQEHDNQKSEMEDNIEQLNAEQPRSSRKSRQILKNESPKKSIVRNSRTPLKSENFPNSDITDDSQQRETNTEKFKVDISICQILNHEVDNSMNLENTTDNIKNSRSRRSWKLLSNEINNELEENNDATNIEIPRTSRKSWRILNSEDIGQEKNNSRSSIRKTEVILIPTTDEIDQSHLKTSRRSWRIPSPEITDKTIGENIDRSSVRNSRTSRKIELVDIPRADDETEEEDTTKTHLENSRTSRRSEQILNIKASDETVEEEKSINRPIFRNSKTPNVGEMQENTKVHIDNSRTSRRSWKIMPSEIKEEAIELEDDIDNLAKDEVVSSFNESTLSVVHSKLKNGKDEIQLHKNSTISISKSPSTKRKTPVKQKERKRWTILKCDEGAVSSQRKDDYEEKATIEDKSEIIKSSPKRRSVRKRWSTELKKKSFNPNDFQIKEIIEPSTNEISKEESMRIDHEDLNASNSPLKTSKKSESSIHLDSTFVRSSPADKWVLDKNFSVSDSENCNINTPDRSLRRSSKRYSKSLDFLEGFSPLEETLTLETVETTNHLSRKPSTPGSILKRRGTYDLDESVTDVSILKSLSEGNLSNTGLPSDDISEETTKSVRFQHVTKRKPCLKRNNYLHSPQENPLASARKVPPKIGAANKSVSFDQTIFSASSCSTSTPLHSSKKNDLLKQILTKNNSNGLSNKRRSRSVEEKREKCVSRIRMPNFSKIHQRWNDKLEDISEMAARKAERARLLLSGQKPSASSTSSSNESQRNNNDKTKHPKQLNFTKNQQPPNIGNIRTPNISKTKKQGSPKKFKVEDNFKKQAVVSKIQNGKLETISSKNLLMKSGIPKKLQITKPTQNVLKRTEEIKSLATKSKPQHDTKEERRTILKGVRGNRRFELLMKMRNK